MASKGNRLWGTTRLGPYEIKIYVNPRLVNYDGFTYEHKTGIVIELAESVLDDPGRLDETLIHELVHVLEFLHPKKAFSIRRVDGCTALAQTMGRGLAQMFRELSMAAKPSKAHTKRKAPKKRRK